MSCAPNNRVGLQEDQEEPADASAAFSRQRELPLAMDDEIQPMSDIEADSHEVSINSHKLSLRNANLKNTP